MNGTDIRKAIAVASPLSNPRIAEVEWDDVADELDAKHDCQCQCHDDAFTAEPEA